MAWNIAYHTEAVESFVLGLPDGLLARYLKLTEMMLEFGANLGMPHTRAMSDGLFELRIKGKEGIARVFYCTLIGQRIVMLHGFVKKTDKTPPKELKLARERLAEVKKS
ncbi:MAG: phage derived protein Gp49-like protein [Hydrocarboniphaga sp.]|uniref:type II toxin-antitoxin system RelE/ParE family toxin n=1 Tax=Hydrocarboniphaga sp. TaxID=2033016 RepID=UPI00260EEDA3|nr:type II toxin-antitoxin system RelE/ParE family toxin [Hydrocarboniphaga sp.]MDB5968825.1 phage derived protein Gp49-like protein [Hydrocarboniphaga sp.]